MSEKKPKRPQKKPSKQGRGKPRKPPYGELPFSMKLTLSKTGMYLLHPATAPAIFRNSGYGKPIPKAALKDPTLADLNKISDPSLHQQFAEYAVWLGDLGPDSKPAYADDLHLFLAYAYVINRLGRFPAMQEIVAFRKKLEPKNKNANLVKGLSKNLPKMRLPYVDDNDFDLFKACIKDRPSVIDDPAAFREIATVTAPIYTPIERWPLDLICHLLVGAELGGLEDDNKPVFVKWYLPVYLEDLNQAAFKRASDTANASGKDWRKQPAEERSRTREMLEEYGRQWVAQAMPWLEEGERLCEFTYSDGDHGIAWKIRDEAANWDRDHSGESAIDSLHLPRIAAILEKVEARNLRLLQQWARELLTA